MQHLPSLPFVLRLFFLQVHQTNIPATTSAATDPNTAPTVILTVSTKREKLDMNFCKWERIFSSQTICSNFSCIEFRFSQRNPFFTKIEIKGCGGQVRDTNYVYARGYAYTFLVHCPITIMMGILFCYRSDRAGDSLRIYF